MVGFVLVSHSRDLAKGLLALIKQVANPNVPVAIAAGAGPDHTDFGTDAIEIMEAIQTVSSPDGVVVLMDLGSAVLSAQMAIDLLPPEISSGVRLCAAPLVEGSMAAVVQAGLGSDADTICREAEGALLPKREQVGVEEPAAEISPAAPEPAGGLKRTLVLKNRYGLHARPASRFVQTAGSFDAVVQVRDLTNQKGPVSARSLNAIATLGAVGGHEIEISASGLQAQEALDALGKMVDEGFGELGEEVAPEEATLEEKVPIEGEGIRGLPIADGVAVGPLYHYRPVLPPVSQALTDNPPAERARLQQAIQSVAQQIAQRSQQTQRTLGKSQAAIFEAHQLILQDPELQAIASQRIMEKSENAALAWQQACEQIAENYRSLEDPYLRQRAVDVMDISRQVLFELSGRPTGEVKLHFDHPVVLFARDLTPTETSQMAMDQVLAVLTAQGSTTSHAAILARAMGIPAVFGLEDQLADQPDDTLVAVDGFNGEVVVQPDETQQATYAERRQTWLTQREKLRASSDEPARMKDGHVVEVAANIGGVKDAETAVSNGADGVGLLRTEFLFLTRQTPPNEDEQTETLNAIVQTMKQRPIIVRTLDVGGDKPLPYIQMPSEENPFLGVRAIRLMRQHPDLFQTQLRAILRAGVNGPLRIMIPMVANLSDVDFARQQLERAHQALSDAGVTHAWQVQLGIMVEIPSAALLSRELAEQVDFFSIGTNDLTQYTLAAERGNPALAEMTDAMHPAVLRLIGRVVENAHACQKWVGVCGELAGDAAAAPVLVGLGVDELSMNPGDIPRVKQFLRSIDYSTAQTLAAKVLKTNSAPAARQMAREFVDDVAAHPLV
jgi:phosphocarrier protein FPr